MRIWMLWGCAIWICWTAASAQQQERLVYRGKMGNYATIENLETGKVTLLKKGEKLDKRRLVEIGKEQLLFADSNGKEYRIAKTADARASLPQADAIAYPWQKFADEERIQRKLANTTFRLSYYSTPLADIVEEWRRLADIAIVIDPQIHFNTKQQLRVTLSSDEISLKKALDLLTTYMDLVYYLEPERIVIGRAGDRPASPLDPQQKYWRGLQQAQTKLLQEDAESSNGAIPEKMERVLEQVIDLDLERVPVDKLAERLEKTFGCPVLVNGRAVNSLKKRQQDRIIFLAHAITVKKALHQLCTEYKLAWEVVGIKIYISSPEHIELLSRQQKQKQKQQSQWQRQQEPLSGAITLPKGWHSFANISEHLQQKCQLTLVVSPEIWQENYHYFANGQALTLRAILDKIAAEIRARYVIEPGVIYLLRPDILDNR